MKKLSVKSIIDFRRKSDRSKRNFVAALKIDKEKVKTEGGGNYWISCLTAITSGCKLNNSQIIIDRIDDLKERYDKTPHAKIKTMYERNLDILYKYEGFDFKKWRPKQIQFIKQHKENFVITIKGIQVQVDPQCVFEFQKDEIKEVGAIWFIAQLEGFRKEELGVFVDALYHYLNTHFGKVYRVNPKYCIAVDVFNKLDVKYEQLEKGEVPWVLNRTLEEIKKLM